MFLSSTSAPSKSDAWKARRIAQGIHGGVDIGAQTPAYIRGVARTPLFAPALCWRARMVACIDHGVFIVRFLHRAWAKPSTMRFNRCITNER
ncbi:MAG: hypothetical protein ABS92_01805 [Thiobacillus sp. SCN 63-374]|nr:MAG: hypothetical protein ABS92_01805 [Thiobacillus sp. SCN 63-374]